MQWSTWKHEAWILMWRTKKGVLAQCAPAMTHSKPPPSLPDFSHHRAGLLLLNDAGCGPDSAGSETLKDPLRGLFVWQSAFPVLHFLFSGFVYCPPSSNMLCLKLIRAMWCSGLTYVCRWFLCCCFSLGQLLLHSSNMFSTYLCLWTTWAFELIDDFGIRFRWLSKQSHVGMWITEFSCCNHSANNETRHFKDKPDWYPWMVLSVTGNEQLMVLDPEIKQQTLNCFSRAKFLSVTGLAF